MISTRCNVADLGVLSHERQKVTEVIHLLAEANGIPKETAFDAEVVLGEFMTNCHRHGRDKEVVIQLLPGEHLLTCTVLADSHRRCHGPISDQLKKSRPGKKVKVVSLDECGRGIDIAVCLSREISLENRAFSFALQY